MPARLTIDAFWERAEPEPNSGCWLWLGAPNQKTGYGQAKFCGRKVDAHRLAWEFTHGLVPSGLSVLHRCDVRTCVRPEHLFLGTHLDNMRDMNFKGRGASGARNGASRLTDENVADIRQLSAAGTSQSTIAARFNIGQATVSHICLRHTWRHLV